MVQKGLIGLKNTKTALPFRRGSHYYRMSYLNQKYISKEIWADTSIWIKQSCALLS